MNLEDLLQPDLTAHRPWPTPASRWRMRMRWHDVLLAHWRVAANRIRPLVPEPLELDSFDGDCWISVVPFRMSDVSPRGVPALPLLSSFAEINVRTYVRVGGKGGVWFFSLDAANLAAVLAARITYHLPYYYARISTKQDGEWLQYASSRIHPGGQRARFRGRYRPSGPSTPAQAGSLEHWLVERYCLYARAGSRILRGDVHHIPWPLAPAEVVIEANSMAEPLGITLNTTPEASHFASDLQVVAWSPLAVAEPQEDAVLAMT